MQLIFLYGAPAVGKLTVARELAALTRIPLFHNHLAVDLLTPVFAFGSEPFVRLREEIWLEVFGAAAEHPTSLIFTFAPERTVRPSFVSETVKVVERAGGEVTFVRLTCADAELERRLTDPSRAGFGKLRSLEQLRALIAAGAFVYPMPAPALSVDTGALSPRVAAETIHDFLRGRGPLHPKN